MDDARKSLLKLSSAKNRPDIEGVLVMIEQTDLLEQELESTTTYLDCFKGANLARTEISIMVYLIQVGVPLFRSKDHADNFCRSSEEIRLLATPTFSSNKPGSALPTLSTVIFSET